MITPTYVVRQITKKQEQKRKEKNPVRMHYNAMAKLPWKQNVVCLSALTYLIYFI